MHHGFRSSWLCRDLVSDIVPHVSFFPTAAALSFERCAFSCVSECIFACTLEFVFWSDCHPFCLCRARAAGLVAACTDERAVGDFALTLAFGLAVLVVWCVAGSASVCGTLASRDQFDVRGS